MAETKAHATSVKANLLYFTANHNARMDTTKLAESSTSAILIQQRRRIGGKSPLHRLFLHVCIPILFSYCCLVFVMFCWFPNILLSVISVLLYYEKILFVCLLLSLQFFFFLFYFNC